MVSSLRRGLDAAKRACARWPDLLLWAALLANTALSAGLVIYLLAKGESLRDAASAIGSLHAATLLGPVSDDSWTPMLRAYELKLHDAAADVYRLILHDHVKFQYPPTALLLFRLLPSDLLGLDSHGAAGRPLLLLLSVWSRAGVFLNAAFAAAILEIAGRRAAMWPKAWRARSWLRLGCVCVLAFGFYPMLKAYSLGQLQVFLNCAVSGAVLAFMFGRKAVAGAVLALCCAMKPQYGVVLVWALLRRSWRFAAAFAAVLGVCLALSVASGGLSDYLRYLDVLRMLSRHGEVYWPNQSLSGLLHRLLDPQAAIEWHADAFGADVPWIALVSSLWSLLVLCASVWPRRRGLAAVSGELDFAVVLAAATLASPVAWEHHYGYFAALFALALPAVWRTRPLGSASLPLLGLCFLAVSNQLLRPALLYHTALRGLLLGSGLFYGALGLFGFLLLLRARAEGAWHEVPLRGAAAKVAVSA